LRPDVAILGTSVPGDVLRATRLIHDGAPATRVLLIADKQDEELLLRALYAGAVGYVTKASPVESLIDGIRAAHAGQLVIEQEMLVGLLARLIRERREQDTLVRRTSALTRREREVLALLARGLGNEGIADALVISPQTARTHVQNVIGKLGVHSRLEAAMFATRSGLVDDLEPDRPEPLQLAPTAGPFR
jgi:DNA-binding NarL/FixJ family response regulator